MRQSTAYSLGLKAPLLAQKAPLFDCATGTKGKTRRCHVPQKGGIFNRAAAHSARRTARAAHCVWSWHRGKWRLFVNCGTFEFFLLCQWHSQKVVPFWPKGAPLTQQCSTKVLVVDNTPANSSKQPTSLHRTSLRSSLHVRIFS